MDNKKVLEAADKSGINRIIGLKDVTVSLRRDLLLFLFLAVFGSAAAFISVNIPHTEVYLEGRFIFGFMGFVLIRRVHLVLLLQVMLSIAGFHQVPFYVYLPGNLLYALPFGFSLRFLHNHILDRLENLLFYGVCWFFFIMAGYQLFTTPLTWMVMALLHDAPLNEYAIQAWMSQPYFFESVGVGLFSALGMVISRMYFRLEQRERHIFTILNSIGDAVVVTDQKGRVELINPVGEALLGWKNDEAQGRDIGEVFRIENEDTGKPCPNPVKQVLEVGAIVGLANHTILINREGKRIPIADSGAPVMGMEGEIKGVVLVFRDVTEKKIAEDTIKKELTQKNVLLQEVHHRVKNNLQIISSLLGLQAGQIEDEASRKLLLDSRRRIASMAQVHNQLYAGVDFSKINFEQYIQTISAELLDSGDFGQQVTIFTEVGDLALKIEKAVPFGLILNELITNSLQHAFPDQQKGNISIFLSTEDSRSCEFVYMDDGIGIPDDLDIIGTDSLGMTLIQSLAEQLNGTCELERMVQGTRCRICFPL